MFSRKEKQKRNRSGKSLSQYGLFDIPSNLDDSGNEDVDENDSDLEAELAALSGASSNPPQRKKPAKKIIPERELNAMVADSMKDIDDDDISVDENDPELLDELSELTGDAADDNSPTAENEPPSVDSTDTERNLSERIKNYEIAEKTAKEAGEVSKSKRYGRAVKTLKDLLKQAKLGKAIDLNDETVPPEIQPVTDKPPSQPVPSRPAPAIPFRAPVSQDVEENVSSAPILPEVVEENVKREKQNIDEELLDMLHERQKEYKVAALTAKKTGDAKTAIVFVKIAKQFDAVIVAVQNGQEVDLSKMPGPPSELSLKSKPKIEESETQKNSIPEITLPEEATSLPEPQLLTATTDLEALEQRLSFYKEHETQAKEQENSSKARRYGRLVKQFEQALKSHKAGKSVALDELPTPPGFGPFPSLARASEAEKPVVNMPANPPKTSSAENDDKEQTPSQVPKVSGNTTHAEKQVLILLAKQKQFKQAALSAKKQGELTQAKEFLKQAKGFDKLIEAAQAGLPVDWSSIPVSPEAKSQLDNEYDIIMAEEAEDVTGDFDLSARLENQLQKQLKMCLTTRDHNKALGDVASTNKFERLALNVTKDLDVVRMARKTSKVVPKFHYEQKDFSIVKSFTEIMDNQMEVTVHRGINYQSDNPKEIDTYVKLEFPFPQDTPFSDRTSTIKDTNNPEYQKTFVIPIQRNSRQCQRTFKRHGIKFEVYSRGGFFRSDVLIGTVNVKLQPLETQCEIHDSFDLLDGRKKVGGKLEVQMKLRTPIVTQQVEHIQEKWLIIDQ